MLPEPGKLLFYLKLAGFAVLGLLAARIVFRQFSATGSAAQSVGASLTNGVEGMDRVVPVTLRRVTPTSEPFATNDSVGR